MNDAQRKGMAMAEEKIRPAMELYEHRNRISYLAGKLSLRDLKRLVQILDALEPDELKQVAAYAEGLAAWRPPAQESPDASISKPGTPAPGCPDPGT